jgi:hypothetical protein
LTTCGNVQAVEKLGQQYLISYGKEDASIKLVEYFSFQCPHCINIFKNDFARIKKEYIDTGKILFEFHPTPLDLPTLQAMVCLAQLDAHQKQLFLEVMFEEAIPNEPELMAQFMMAAMGIFKKPLPLCIFAARGKGLGSSDCRDKWEAISQGCSRLQICSKRS